MRGGGLRSSGQSGGVATSLSSAAWPLLGPSDSASAPNYSWSDSPTYGMYHIAGGGVILSVGSARFYAQANALYCYKPIIPSTGGGVTLGTASSPWGDSYLQGGKFAYLREDEGDYIYSPADNQVALYAGGLRYLHAAASQLTLNYPIAPNTNESADCGVDAVRFGRIVASGQVHDMLEQDGDYTILATDNVIRESSAGAFTYTLPDAPPNGTRYTTIANGDSDLTIATAGSETISGAATHTVSLGTAVKFIYSSARTQWVYIVLGAAG